MRWEHVQLAAPHGNKKGSQTALDTIDMNSEYIFGHKMVKVHYKRKFVKLDEMGEPDYGQAPHYIKHEGIYCFGGVCGKKTSE